MKTAKEITEQIQHYLSMRLAASSDRAKGIESIVQTVIAERDKLRAQVASLTADKTNIHVTLIELLHRFGTGETEEHDGERITEMVERIVSERDRLMADVVQYRRALEDAFNILEHGPTNCFTLDDAHEMAKAALATEHPGAPLVVAVGKAYEYLDRIHKGDPVPADMLANNAKACLKPFLPLDEPSKPS